MENKEPVLEPTLLVSQTVVRHVLERSVTSRTYGWWWTVEYARRTTWASQGVCSLKALRMNSRSNITTTSLPLGFFSPVFVSERESSCFGWPFQPRPQSPEGKAHQRRPRQPVEARPFCCSQWYFRGGTRCQIERRFGAASHFGCWRWRKGGGKKSVSSCFGCRCIWEEGESCWPGPCHQGERLSTKYYH